MANKSSDLSHAVIDFVRRAGKPSTTLEIAKALGKSRKELNHTLYELQRRGKLLKVVESPPTWQLSQQPSSLGNHSSMNKLRGGVLRVGRGRGRGRSPTPPSTGYPFNQPRVFNFPGHAPNSADSQFRRSRASGPNVPSSASLSTGASSAQQLSPDKADMQEKLLAELSKHSQPRTALELAHALGFPSRKHVNPALYDLKKRGILASSEGNGAPRWHLPSSGGATSSTSNSAPLQRATLTVALQEDVRHRAELVVQPTVSHGQGSGQIQPSVSQSAIESSYQQIASIVLNHLNKAESTCSTLDLSRVAKVVRSDLSPVLDDLHSEGYISQEREKPPCWRITSSGREMVEGDVERDSAHSEEELEVEESSLTGLSIDLSGIPEEDIQQRLLAILQQDPSTERTDLELAKIVGETCTRAEVRPVLEELASRGVVKKGGKFPIKWSAGGEASGEQMVESMDHSGSYQQQQDQHPSRTITNTASTAVPSTVGTAVTSMITDMNRNPVSALSEYCQANKLELNFVEVRECGPPHMKRFVMAASFGGKSFEAEATTKKEAKRMAADLALQDLKLHQVFAQIPAQSASAAVQVTAMPSTFPDRVAHVSHQFHAQVQSSVDIPQPGRKVIAAFVMENSVTKDLTVVSLGSGTRCITGEQMSLEGMVVNDSHAEVIARRSLMRFFYRQLSCFHRGAQDTIFVKDDRSDLARVSEEIKFHLYISTAPCGDGAQFSRGDDVNRQPPDSDTHLPTMVSRSQGVLRTKMEGGEGTIPISDDVRPQTWDGIQQGGRLRTMSCSDKVARWNTLGLQGALLSHFMRPVYMSSLTLGSLHHHGHLSRAVCCRFNDLSSSLPETFRVNHPSLGRVLGGDEMKRHTEKTSNFSLNWCLGDDCGELNDGSVGRPVPPPGTPKSSIATMVSRVSKLHLFGEFLKLAEVARVRERFEGRSYKECKEMATEFQEAKKTLYKLCEERGYGMWMKKPIEQEQFDSQVLELINTNSR